MNRIHRHLSTVTALTSLDRYGKQSSSTYGKIDDLTCSYDGNHLTAISDNAPIPTISGSFDFKDEASTTAEYLYDENGLRPDVTKGNNNRVVVAENDSIVQINHYYPYGGVIGDISTLLSDVTKGNNENVQKYKLFHYIPREQARSEGPRSHQKEIDNLLARRRAFRRGVELDRTFGLDNYDIHARQYFAMAPMWDKPDSKAEDYYPISPYAYCGGDTVNNGDYNGEKIIFINGKIGGGSPPSGAEYWNGEHSSFVLQAQAVLNDNSVVFSTEDYGYLSTAEERRQQGYKYAKFNFEEWASNMNTDETFKLVSHSMGGAFSMGIEDYIKEQGREVEVNAMINTYQVDHIDIDATSSTVYIDYQNKNDPVLFWFDDNLGYGKLNNADIIIRESSNAKLLYIHRSPIDSGNFWETVRQCLNQK